MTSIIKSISMTENDAGAMLNNEARALQLLSNHLNAGIKDRKSQKDVTFRPDTSNQVLYWYTLQSNSRGKFLNNDAHETQKTRDPHVEAWPMGRTSPGNQSENSVGTINFLV